MGAALQMLDLISTPRHGMSEHRHDPHPAIKEGEKSGGLALLGSPQGGYTIHTRVVPRLTNAVLDGTSPAGLLQGPVNRRLAPPLLAFKTFSESG